MLADHFRDRADGHLAEESVDHVAMAGNPRESPLTPPGWPDSPGSTPRRGEKAAPDSMAGSVNVGGVRPEDGKATKTPPAMESGGAAWSFGR